MKSRTHKFDIIHTYSNNLRFLYRNYKTGLIYCMIDKYKGKTWSLMLHGLKAEQIKLYEAMKVVKRKYKEKLENPNPYK